MIGIARKVELVHDALDKARIPHAFGGALALAYCVSEPRGTMDIDLNVFVKVDRAREVVGALPSRVAWTERDLARAIEDGQVRLWWGENPLDIFFSYHPFHDELAERAHTVPFETTSIPVLDCGDLVVLKALFGRPKDWVDIENVIESGGVDLDVPLARLEAIVGREDPTRERLAALAKRSNDEGEAYRRAFGRPERTDEQPSR